MLHGALRGLKARSQGVLQLTRPGCTLLTSAHPYLCRRLKDKPRLHRQGLARPLPGLSQTACKVLRLSVGEVAEHNTLGQQLDYAMGGLPHMAEDAPASVEPLCLDKDSISTKQGVAVLERLGPNIKVCREETAAHTMVLGVTSSSGPVSSLDMVVGKLRFKRFLACARCKLWWMTPEWGTSMAQLPAETQFLLLEVENGGPYAIVLPLIDGDFRATLQPASSSDSRYREHLGLRLESGDPRVRGDSWDKLLLVAAGQNPFELVEAGVAAAARLSGGARPRTQKQMPPSLDVFGWCTWDAFYSTVSARGLRDGLAALQEGGIQPRTLIIDDGWQMTAVDEEFSNAPTTQLVDRAPPARLDALRETQEDLRQLLNDTDEDFFQESAEVLSQAASQLPQGTSAGNVMPTLAGVGPPPHPSPHHQGVTEPSGAQSLLASGTELQRRPQKAEALYVVRLAQKVAGWIAGAASALILILYQWVVEPAAPGSWPVRVFTSMAHGPLRGAMLNFYAGASDFSRRIISVKANSKFSSPDAGPEDDGNGKPENLKGVVEHIKERFQIKYVYCWHGLPAYWGGVMPQSPELPNLPARIVYPTPVDGILAVEPSLAWSPAVLAGVGVVDDPSELYQSMHSYLSSAGVDGVKVDCQAGVGLVGSCLGGGPALSRRFHAALEDSVSRHFPGNHAINCMCHSTENLYRMAGTAVARASDDFYPRDPASSLPHIGSCAFNSLFLGALLQPDWDMFHSRHPAAMLHATARAVSGGAVYVSDKPGEHDFELLRRLVLPDGSVLRARHPGRPTKDCLFTDVMRDGKSLLKVWNMNAVVGVAALFNLQGASWDRRKRKFHRHNTAPPMLSSEVRPGDVDDLRCSSRSGGVPAAFATYYSGTQRLMVVALDAATEVCLPAGGSEIVSFSPLLESGGVRFAPLGLRDMLNGGGAVLAVCSSSGQTLGSPDMAQLRYPGGNGTGMSALNGNGSVSNSHSAGGNGTNGSVAHAHNGSGATAEFVVSIRGCGKFLAYSDSQPKRVAFGNEPVEWSHDAADGALVVEIPATSELAGELCVVY